MADGIAGLSSAMEQSAQGIPSAANDVGAQASSISGICEQAAHNHKTIIRGKLGMKCEKCGDKIPAGSTFCPKCGNKIANKQERIVKVEKKYFCMIAVVIVLAVSTGIIYKVQGAGNFSKKLEAFETYCAKYRLGDMEIEYQQLVEKAKRAIDSKDTERYRGIEEDFEEFQLTLAEYSRKLESYENSDDEFKTKFGMLRLTESQEATYFSLMKKLNEGLEVASVSQMETAINELDDIYEEFRNNNLEIAEQKKEEIDSYSPEYFLDAEMQLLEQYENSATSYMEGNNYRQVLNEYDKCITLFENIKNADNFRFQVEQIDASEFPTVKLFISAHDIYADNSISIKPENLVLKQLNNGIYGEIKAARINKLNTQEKLNTCLVGDVSGSMYSQMDTVKVVMINFANCMQYDAGDEVSLITFDNYVNLNLDFTKNRKDIVNKIQNIYVGNCTALFDALYVAVCKASCVAGAKCVIAFTDGYDNVSAKTADDVIRIANLYDVPVYLVGIGYDVDNALLEFISTSTGGYYRNIYDGSEIGDIFDSIYQENKEMYMIEYTASVTDADVQQNIYLAYHDRNNYMRCEYQFLPSQLQANEDEYMNIIQDAGIPNTDIEDEVLRIRGIYNHIVENRTNNNYQVSSPYEGVTVYSENGEVRCVIVSKGVHNNQYARYYYYENRKLIFAYIEGSDSHRLYFHNDKMFRWRYASNAVNYSEADNHDNEDSEEFRTWEAFALNEGYLYNQ